MKYWIPFLAWVLLIFVGSGDVLSAEHTSQFIEPILRWLWPNLSSDTIEQIHFCLRKAAHVLEYLILALLLFRAISHTVAMRLKKASLLFALLMICVAF